MRTGAGILFFLLAVGLQFKAIGVFRAMMNAVNATLPPESRIPDIGPSWLRGKVIRLHKQRFPESQLRKELYGFWFAMLAAFLVAVGSVVSFK
jgi:hypothetical protein